MEKQKSVGHIYTFAITWLLLFIFAFGRNIHNIQELILLLAGSFGAAFFVYFILRKRRSDAKSESIVTKATRPASTIPELTLTGIPELDEMIREATTLLYDLNETYKELRNREVAQKVREVIEVSNDIIEKLRRDPEQLSSVKRFLSYSLPTAKKLIDNYSYMESQRSKGENIINAMTKIEGSLGILVTACKKQLDKLFSHTTMDIEADISVLESVLKSEGLSEKSFRKEETNENI